MSTFLPDRFLIFFLVRRHITFRFRLLQVVDWQSCMGSFIADLVLLLLDIVKRFVS